MNWQEQILSKNIKQTGIFKEKTLMKTRMEKLEILVGLEEGIQSFKDQIELKQDSINGCPGIFNNIRDKYTDDIHTYKLCIKRLEQRFSKVRKTLK